MNASQFDEDLNDVVDFIQDNLECCGISNNTVDWFTYSPFSMMLGRVPGSCCGLEGEEECQQSDIFEDVSHRTYYIIWIAMSTNKYILH